VLGHNRVLGGYHDASGLIHEQRSKRVISILSGADCELDGLPDEFLMTGLTPESLRVCNCADDWGDAVRCSATVDAAVWRNLRRFEFRIYLLPSFALVMTLDLRAMITRSSPHPEWRSVHFTHPHPYQWGTRI
jgi:hypothetical protein